MSSYTPQSQSLASPEDKSSVRFAAETHDMSATFSTPVTPPEVHSLHSTLVSPESTRSEYTSSIFESSGRGSLSSASSPLHGRETASMRTSMLKDATLVQSAAHKPRTGVSGHQSSSTLQRSLTDTQTRLSAAPATPRRNPLAVPPSFSGHDIDLANRPFSTLVASAGNTPGRALFAGAPASDEDDSPGPREHVSTPSVPQKESRFVQTLHASMQASPTRWLQVSGLPRTLNSAYLLEHIFGEYGSLQGMWPRRLMSDGIIIIGYNDLRDALRAFKALRHKRFFNERLLSAQFVSRQLLKSLVHEGTDVLLSGNIGQVSIAIRGLGECPKDVLYSLFSSYGDIEMFRSCEDDHGSRLVCEYFDLRDASLAVRELDSKRVRDCTLMVHFVPPEESQTFASNAHALLARHHVWDALGQSSPIALSPLNCPTQSSIPLWFTPDLHPAWAGMSTVERSHSWQAFEEEQKHRVSRHVDPSRRASSAKIPLVALEPRKYSPTANVKVHLSTPTPKHSVSGYFDLPRAQSRMTPISSPAGVLDQSDALKATLLSQLARFTPSSGAALGSTDVSDRNKVTAERIEAGTDARTTIMIKNIPNKFTQAMLKDWIDETSADCYDFLYLRIDFQNKCNVGYAFVNFVEPRDIVTFSQRRVGASWNVFSSEKRCDISYANIQGRDKLIEKFRNSSVMDQDPAFRPKLFHTIGSLKGQEEAFPACNDPKKKARSTMDAQTTGLFPPVGSLSNSRAGTPVRTPVRERTTGRASPSVGLMTPPLTIRTGQNKDAAVGQSPLAKVQVR